MMDCIFLKLRQGEEKKKPIYIVLGIDGLGYRKILG